MSQKSFWAVLPLNVVLAVALVVFPAFAYRSLAADLLSVGSDAPSLDIEHWIQDGNGKFQHVKEFEKGKVYVVEFWATWCGPCVQSMPHLAQLQADYATKGVQIISISDEDMGTIDAFLAREVRGSKPTEADGKKQTYRELTSAYCLTTDPDRSVAVAYMEAARQGGIPTAFIVGKDSKIEWIGHPMRMDETLAAVVEDRWDRAAYIAELKMQEELNNAVQDIDGLVQRKEFDKAIELADKLVEKHPKVFQIKVLKLEVMVLGGKAEVAAAYAESLFKDMADRPDIVSVIAWHLYEANATGRLKAESMVPIAIQAMEQAIAKLEKENKANAMDTLAHLLSLKGENAKAIEIETKAIEMASQQDKAFMQQFLEQLKSQQQ